MRSFEMSAAYSFWLEMNLQPCHLLHRRQQWCHQPAHISAHRNSVTLIAMYMRTLMLERLERSLMVASAAASGSETKRRVVGPARRGSRIPACLAAIFIRC